MKVELVWVTPDAEKLIAHIARVSNPKNQDNPEYTGLIRYLIKNKHWSPFEMSCMCLKIETSRAIAQQIIRHKSFSFQELSQRYTAVDTFEPIELRKQAEKNRQSSLEVFDPYIQEFTDHYDMPASELINKFIDMAEELYKKLIDANVAKEVARMILPLTTQTTLYMTGSCRSWIHYLELRTDEHTQKEHRLVAEQAKGIFITQFPTVSTAMGWTHDTTKKS